MAEKRELKKMTTRFFADDLVTLKTAYPHSGYNTIVRALVSKHCRRLEAIAADKLDEDFEIKLTPQELNL